MRERHTALSVVVMYLSSPAFVSPLIGAKYNQLAPSRCPPGPCVELLGVFFPIGTNQDNPAAVWQRERENETQGRVWQRDCGFKVYTSDSCCMVRVRGISWMEVS